MKKRPQIWERVMDKGVEEKVKKSKKKTYLCQLN